jgi:DNA repair protein RadC
MNTMSELDALMQSVVVRYPDLSRPWLVQQALAVLAEDIAVGDVMADPTAVRQYLQLRLAGLPHEIFGVLFLDAQNRLIGFEEMFRGTLTQTSVYPREVLKQALALNAASVVLTHNHPSGNAEPSSADLNLTRTLKSALALVDVRVLDHFIVTRGGVLSFAEHGLI